MNSKKTKRENIKPGDARKKGSNFSAKNLPKRVRQRHAFEDTKVKKDTRNEELARIWDDDFCE